MTRARILANYVAGGTTAAEFDHIDGLTSTAVGINDTQTLTNKTLSSGAIGSGVKGRGYWEFFDAWRLHTSLDGATTPVLNWEREDVIDDGAGGDQTMPGQLHIGGLTQTGANTGIWTFPSTGKYLMWLQIVTVSQDTQWQYMAPQLYLSSGWRLLGKPYNGNTDGSSIYQTASSCFFINVSDTSTQQLRFMSSRQSSTGSFFGDTRGTGTGFKICKFGDYIA